MAKGKIQWQKEKYNGKRKNTMAKNTMAKEKIQWQKKKNKKTNNDLQHHTQRTED